MIEGAGMAGAGVFIGSEWITIAQIARILKENDDLGSEVSRLRAANADMVRGFRSLARDYDHCEDSHRYDNGACRVCIAEEMVAKHGA
jgi:hypothetical protein